MDKSKNKLIMTIGLPCSGKSNYCQQQVAPIVSPDAIRLALHGQRFISEAETWVWVIAKLMVKALFLAGHTVVLLNAYNSTAKRRDHWKSDAWDRKYIVIDVHREVCIARAEAAGDKTILPIIERMAYNLEYEGVFYGSSGNDPMGRHIEFPKGDQMQIYHVGTAND